MTQRDEQSKLSSEVLMFERAHKKIAIGLNLYVCVNGSGMGIGKVEHKSLPCFVFLK
jgi:hypothetical protein